MTEFDRAYAEIAGTVRGLLQRRYPRSWEDAEQAARVGAWMYFQRYNPSKGKLSTWMHCGALSAAKHWVRDYGYLVAIPASQQKPGFNAPEIASLEYLEEWTHEAPVAMDSDVVAGVDLANILASLPDKHLRVAKLCSEGYSLVESARIMGYSLNYVVYMRQQVRNRLQRHGYGPTQED